MGIIEIAILVGIGYLISTVVKRGKNKSYMQDYEDQERWIPGQPRHPSIPAPPIERSTTEAFDAKTPVGAPPQMQQLTPAQAREKRIAELRRLYVEDAISVEEYEAELDKLMKPDASGE